MFDRSFAARLAVEVYSVCDDEIKGRGYPWLREAGLPLVCTLRWYEQLAVVVVGFIVNFDSRGSLDNNGRRK